MKKCFTLIFLIILTFIPFISSQSNDVSPTINVNREAELTSDGVLLVKDTFEIGVSNGETVQLSSLFIGFDEGFSDINHDFKVFSSGKEIGTTVNLVKVGNVSGYELTFSDPVKLIDQGDLEIEAFYGFVNLSEYLGLNYLFSIPVYPVIELEIDQLSFELMLPRDLILENVTSRIQFVNTTDNGRVTVRHESQSIPPFSYESIDIAYVLPENVYVAVCELLDYEIQVKSQELLIQETVRIKNLGSPMFDFRVPVLDGATNIQARDKVGPLDVESNSSNGNLFAWIEPRLALLNSSKWEFTIFYWVDESLYVNRNGNRDLDFITPIFPLFVETLQVQIVLPEGSEVIELMEDARVHEDDRGIHVAQSYVNVLPSEQKNVNLIYGLGSTGSTLVVPLGLVILFVVVVVAVYYLRIRKGKDPQEPRRGPPTRIEVAEVEEPGVEALIRRYNERAEILRELVNLDSEYSEGEISRGDYERRSAEIARQGSRVSTSLRELEASARIEDQETEQKVNNLKRVFSGLSKLENDLRSLDNRYNAGRISRRNYFDRRNRISRRRNEILMRVERILKTLN